MNNFTGLMQAMLGMSTTPDQFFDPAEELFGGPNALPYGPGMSERDYIQQHDLRNMMQRFGRYRPNSKHIEGLRILPGHSRSIIPVPQSPPPAYGDERDWLPGGHNQQFRPRVIQPAPLYRPVPGYLPLVPQPDYIIET